MPKSRILVQPSGARWIFAGFQTAMQDTVAVRMAQAVRGLDHHGQLLFHRQSGPLGDQASQIIAAQEFHRHVRRSSLLTDIEDSCDVRVV